MIMHVSSCKREQLRVPCSSSFPLKLSQQSGSRPIFDILRLAGDGLAPPDPEHQSSCETKTPPRYLADEAYFQ